jgi:hypothetical protein
MIKDLRAEYRFDYRKAKPNRFAVLPYKEFLKVQEELEDYADLRCLREAKDAEKDKPTIGMKELKKKIGKQTNRSCRP